MGRVRIVDVREPDEYVGELGHIRDSKLVPLSRVEVAAEEWDRSQPVVLVCRSGARSGRAAAQLAARGFTRAINMTGGMLSWQARNLPVER
jgi:rhodanese-related sulfurtransferase